ncbi:DUF4124 domain-containing protein [Hydrocarboniclastica marina]|uniref:DUF4124 domain-containing protein n=1 Tax=Hydrocarboniclastica marina TaxID=2259620 RepID=A0A4P7XE36_9ALTE|nr:DUF4124 domain-containing protein [Hydrocarboniclastica marina]QCF24803.1 DUF4124 domain-containing protein [Hydrocarboniclastica marina]
MIRLTRLLQSLGILAAGLTLSAAVTAGTLYRYQDQEGNPVISHTLPQEASQRGYEILTTSGRVIETVPPALTDAQRAAKEAEEQARVAEREKQARQRAADRQLLRTFSHPDDVVRALERKLEQMRSLIELKQGNVVNIRSQIRNEQSRAADAERAGRTIPVEVLHKIQALQQDISETEAEIARQESAISSTVADYEAMADRVEDLTEKQRTKPLPGEMPPESQGGQLPQ